VIADPQGAPINLFKPSGPMKLHDSSKPGEFIWHELLTTDHVAAFAFYSKLFGWQRRSEFDMGPMGKYLIYGNASQDFGGMFTRGENMPNAPLWFYYIQTADLDAAVARAKSKDARLLNGPMEVPGGARIAQLADPQGRGLRSPRGEEAVDRTCLAVALLTVRRCCVRRRCIRCRRDRFALARGGCANPRMRSVN
jgi:predicted enzyme related to lactoylglutathione lyase